MAMVLEGIRVVELARYISGPYCGMLLADLGADVVKVETPAGDPTRFEGPWIGEESLYFAQMNRNKRGVVIDSRSDGRARRADGAAARGRHPDRELPARRDRRDGLRTRGPGGAQPALHHRQRVRLRAGLRDARPHRLRLHPPVPDGPRCDQRAPGRLPDADRGLHRRHGRGPDRDDRRPGRPAAAGADGRRPAGRRRDARQRADAARAGRSPSPPRPARSRSWPATPTARRRRPTPTARATAGSTSTPGPDTFFSASRGPWAATRSSSSTAIKDIVSRVAHRRRGRRHRRRLGGAADGRARSRRSWPTRACRPRASTRSCRRSTTPSCRSATGWSRCVGVERRHDPGAARRRCGSATRRR